MSVRSEPELSSGRPAPNADEARASIGENARRIRTGSDRLPALHAVLALAVVAVWGTNFIVIHAALAHFPPLLLATLRFTFAALPWVAFVKRPRASWWSLVSYGLLIGVGQFGLLYIAMRHDISPGLASLTIQMQVFFTVGFAAWLLRERVRPMQLFALGIAALGLILIALNAQQAATPRGLALTMLAALSWGGSNIIVKKAGAVNALAYVIWSSLFSIPLLFILSLYLEGWSVVRESLSHADALAWSAALWQSVANAIFGFGVWSWLLARHPAATITPTAMLIPLFGLGSSALVLGEPLQPWKLLAAALVVAGLAMNVFLPRPAPQPA
jgi:O-acetylserine/cysteine efflux transporter